MCSLSNSVKFARVKSCEPQCTTTWAAGKKPKPRMSIRFPPRSVPTDGIEWITGGTAVSSCWSAPTMSWGTLPPSRMLTSSGIPVRSVTAKRASTVWDPAARARGPLTGAPSTSRRRSTPPVAATSSVRAPVSSKPASQRTMTSPVNSLAPILPPEAVSSIPCRRWTKSGIEGTLSSRNTSPAAEPS